MAHRDIIVMGASIGGVEALIAVVSRLPANLPATVFVVLHIHPQATSMLPQILARNGRLEVMHPRDGDRIRHGRVYVARPDHHLLVDDGRVRMVKGPRENHHRPAIDPLFRSAARTYGPRVIGVILSGGMDDGAGGVIAVKRRGGVTIVQDPEDAFCPDMPRAALETGNVDHSLPVDEIAVLLARLVEEQSPPVREAPEKLELEADFAQMQGLDMRNLDKLGTPSAFTCPVETATRSDAERADLDTEDELIPRRSRS